MGPCDSLIRHAQSEYNLHVEKHMATRPELKHSPEYWSGDAVFDPHTFDAALSTHGIYGGENNIITSTTSLAHFSALPIPTRADRVLWFAWC